MYTRSISRQNTPNQRRDEISNNTNVPIPPDYNGTALRRSNINPISTSDVSPKIPDTEKSILPSEDIKSDEQPNGIEYDFHDSDSTPVFAQSDKKESSEDARTVGRENPDSYRYTERYFPESIYPNTEERRPSLPQNNPPLQDNNNSAGNNMNLQNNNREPIIIKRDASEEECIKIQNKSGGSRRNR